MKGLVRQSYYRASNARVLMIFIIYEQVPDPN